ncbi:hypothetical protein LCGC14_2054270 [marine sediment metagenome]|uniref:Uncharacterized protein n=1 Tax=marine sediment metagenome TaxID=412755 RepID=A0A0F9EN11_9ZZZZ
MNVTEARGLLVPVRKLQLYARRLQRRGVLAWDWASGLEHGYLGDDRIAFLGDMAALRRIGLQVPR